MVVENSQCTNAESIYEQHLSEIDGIKLTMREIDVVACILHNRGEKKIATLLDISYRTVSSHVRNIMNKLSCNSRDYIIDAIENSGKMQYFGQYYLCLILQGSFIKQLQKIATTINRSGMVCLVNFAKTSEKEQKLLKRIEGHLNLANITLVDKTENATKQLYVINDSTSLSLNTENNVALLLDSKVNLSILDKLEYLDFTNSENYHLEILLLIRKITGTSEIDTIIEEFKVEIAGLQKSFKSTDVVVVHQQAPLREMHKTRFVIMLVAMVFAYGFWFFIQNQEYRSIIKLQQEEEAKEWNVPTRIEHYTPRSKYTKELWKKFKHADDSKGKVSRFVGLHGLSGTGKTTLARNAINFSEQEYSFKAWFNAQTNNSLQADYLGLGEQQNLFSSDNIPVKQKIALVKKWIEQQSHSLLVYDNADGMELLLKYLPNKGDIIITSQNPNISGAIEIDVMDEEIAIKLLDQLVGKEAKLVENYSHNLKSLAQTLGYLPLAISQAGAYINANMLTIQDYLSLYATEQSKLLSDHTMPSMGDHKPAYISWDMSSKKLGQQENGTKALELLNVISCCYSERIPKKLLAQYLYNNTDNASMVELNKLLTTLRKYSLIRTTADTVSVHPLVHEWLNYKLHRNKKGKHKSLLLHEKLCKSLDILMPKVNPGFRDNWHVAKSLLPHIDKVLKLRLEWSQKTNILLWYTSLLNKLGLYYEYIDCHVNEAFSRYQEAEDIYNTINISNSDLAEILVNKGWCFLVRTNITKSLDCFDRALKILENSAPSEVQANALSGKGTAYDRRKNNFLEIDPLKFHLESYEILQKLYPNQDHLMLATSMHNIAWHYKDGGKRFEPDLALEWFNKSLAMRRRLYKGEMHLDIASSLNSIGDLYRKLGGAENLKKALAYQLEGLRIRSTLQEGRISQYLLSSYLRLAKTYEALGYYDKALAINEKMLTGTYELHNTFQHKLIIESFIRLAEIREKLGNPTEAMEYYKKGYVALLRMKLAVSHHRSKKLLDRLKILAPAFVENPEPRIFITQRGDFSKERYDLKFKLYPKILKKLYDCAHQGRWAGSKENNWFKFEEDDDSEVGAVLDYVSDSNIRKVYGVAMTDKQLSIAKELCFEAINFSIMSKVLTIGEKRDLTCLIEFAKQNPEMVKKIADDHPGYFVDGSLLIEAARIGVVSEERVQQIIDLEGIL